MLVDVFKCTFLGMFLACNVNSYARNILWNCFFRISISFTNIINKNAVILALLDCLRDTTCVNLAVCLMKQEGLQMLKHLTKTTFDFFQNKGLAFTYLKSFAKKIYTSVNKLRFLVIEVKSIFALRYLLWSWVVQQTHYADQYR